MNYEDAIVLAERIKAKLDRFHPGLLKGEGYEHT